MNHTRRSGSTDSPMREACSSGAVMGYCARYAIASSAPRRSGPAASRLQAQKTSRAVCLPLSYADACAFQASIIWFSWAQPSIWCTNFSESALRMRCQVSCHILQETAERWHSRQIAGDGGQVLRPRVAGRQPCSGNGGSSARCCAIRLLSARAALRCSSCRTATERLQAVFGGCRQAEDASAAPAAGCQSACGGVGTCARVALRCPPQRRLRRRCCLRQRRAGSAPQPGHRWHQEDWNLNAACRCKLRSSGYNNDSPCLVGERSTKGERCVH